MKQIYLHIGRGKTGTTAIQAALAQHRELLLNNGIHYVAADGGSRGDGHQQFAKSFIARIPDYMKPPLAPDRVRMAVDAEIRSSECETFLLSSENFPLAEVSAVARHFEALRVPNVVRIIFFVRTHDELVESEYNQMVKLKRETRSPQCYAEQALGDADYFKEAQKWEHQFGRENIICRVFDGTRSDAVEQLLACLPGHPPSRLAGIVNSGNPRINESLGIRALFAARLLNMIEVENREALYRAMFEQFSRSDLPALLFDVDEAKQLRARFAESNKRFTARYLGTPLMELGGRRYSDSERAAWRRRIRELDLKC